VPRYGGRAPNEERLVDGNEDHELGNVERPSREAISLPSVRSSGQTVEVLPSDWNDDVESDFFEGNVSEDDPDVEADELRSPIPTMLGAGDAAKYGVL
jgi:hypothetical protein